MFNPVTVKGVSDSSEGDRCDPGVTVKVIICVILICTRLVKVKVICVIFIDTRLIKVKVFV